MKLPRAILTYSGIKNKPFKLVKDINFTLSNGDNMLIKKGYPTDFASLPKPFKVLGVYLKTFDHIGDDLEAFIIHDFLSNYRNYVSDKKLEPIYVTRKFTTKEMKYQMLQYQKEVKRIKPVRNWLFTNGVHFGGIFSYGKI